LHVLEFLNFELVDTTKILHSRHYIVDITVETWH